MRSSVADVLPPRIKRSLRGFGRDLALARRKRNLTIASMAQRVGVANATYTRIEKGDPTVAFGAYAMALYVLGFGDVFADLADTSRDEVGLMLDAERAPKRVRARKTPSAS
jgi:transcriptional regulator with XRE-family HTH domain